MKSRVDERKIKKILSVIKVLLLISVIVVPLVFVLRNQEILSYLKDMDKIQLFLNEHNKSAVLIYLAAQITQIIISVLPGQAFQVAAGYVFGPLMALIYSIIGAVLGTTITFYLSRILGKDFVDIFFEKEKSDYYIERLNSKRAYTIVFFLYLIPGLPKDVISYVGGVSEIKFKPFIVLSTIGRLPGMFGSIIFGSLLVNKQYTLMIILGVVAVIAFIFCIVFRKKISNKLDELYNKVK